MPGVTVTLTNVETGSVRTVTTELHRRLGGALPRARHVSHHLRADRIQAAAARRHHGLDRRDGDGRRRRSRSAALAEAVEVVANAEMVSSGSMTVGAHARSEGARGPADVRPQLHAAARHRAGRLGRHQRAAVERQRVDLAERERRAHHQQQLRLQRRRRHEPALLQQPGQRLEPARSRTAAGRCRATSRRRPRRCRKSSCRRASTTRRPAATAAATSRSSSKSGTNSFRGSGYYYNQNDGLMANDFFFNRAGIEKPDPRRHEGGGTIGGPIIRNKTFFFGSYQRTQARDLVRGRGEQHGAAAAERSPTTAPTPASTRFAAAIWDPQPRPGQLRASSTRSRGRCSRRSSPTART